MNNNSVVKIKIENCKNIQRGEIEIHENILNVKYASNGTGKSTIAEAIKFYFENNEVELKELKTFGATSDPKIDCYLVNNDGTEQLDTAHYTNIEIFNEDFVRDVVFIENEAITQSFDVFIKTPEFNEKRNELDNRLKGLRVEIAEDSDIKEMRRVFTDISSKISLNNNGSIAKRGLVKDILNHNNVYNLPEELQKFQFFFQSDNRVNWVDWKSKGHEYDDKNKCPFCAVELNPDVYEVEKKVFESTYSKAMIKNQKDLENYLAILEPFMNITDFKRMSNFTREIVNESDFEDALKSFVAEVNLVNRKISEIITFDTHGIEMKDLGNLNQRIRGLIIAIDGIKIFNSDKAIHVYSIINSEVESLLTQISDLIGEIAHLNRLIQKAIENSTKDINEFLTSAGIKYQFNIITSSEKSSKAILKYIGEDDNSYDLSKIRKHLSWGEKNSISLILFMYSALQKKADLIILDDPISSFDKNKKYAIMHRLFKGGKEKTLVNKTVLFLTHDFEPIIDLKVKKRFTDHLAEASFLTNSNNILTETKINSESDIKSITVMYLDDAKNENLYIINRVAALRKYYEYMNEDYLNSNAYNILASLMKGRSKPTKKALIKDKKIFQIP